MPSVTKVGREAIESSKRRYQLLAQNAQSSQILDLTSYVEICIELKNCAAFPAPGELRTRV